MFSSHGTTAQLTTANEVRLPRIRDRGVGPARPPSSATPRIYDVQDRLMQYGDFVYTYTDKGELQTKLDTVTGEQWDFSYDVFGNLLSVSFPDGRFIEYVTDGRHRRVGKKVDGVMVRQWAFEDQLSPVAELDGEGNVLWSYVYASRAHSPDFVVSAEGDVYRVIADQLGSPRLIVNVADVSDVLLEAEYGAFGERVVLAGDANVLSLGFAGGELDVDTGLTRFGALDYDHATGRWVSKDPIRFDGGDTNLLAYVVGNPVDLTDPNGAGPLEFFPCLRSKSVEDCLQDEVNRLCQGPLGYLCDDDFDFPAFAPPPPPRRPQFCPKPDDDDDCISRFAECVDTIGTGKGGSHGHGRCRECMIICEGQGSWPGQTGYGGECP